jgi:hypothetical protein
MATVLRRRAGGVDLEVEIERDRMIPGRLVAGVVRATFTRAMTVRGGYATLIGTEHWQVDVTTTDGQGHTRTRTVTRRETLPRIPLQLVGPMSFAAGERREFPFELPVPPLGPATVDATVCGVAWELDVKLDVPGFDPGLVAPVIVLQPTALLRAGVVDVAQYALWPTSDAEADGILTTISLDPVPLCIGAPFTGQLIINAPQRLSLQEVRLEVRVHAQSTESAGKEEEIRLWTSRLAGAGEFGLGTQTIKFEGTLPEVWLPTTRLRHGRTDATFRIVLAQAWARDPNLVRDLAICSTTEV